MSEVCYYNIATKQYFWAKEEYTRLENAHHLERVKKYDNMENNVKQIEKLQTENKELKYYQDQWRKIGGRANLEHLIAKNKKLRECTEFYADKSNWGINRNAKPWNNYSVIFNDVEVERKESLLCYGGKKARETLKEIDKP